MPIRLLFLLALITFSIGCFGQKSIKLEKQKTRFFYTQFNAHGGFVSDLNGARWDVSNRSPNNQVLFQYFSKSKRRLMKGYVKSISLNSFKLKAAIQYNQYVNLIGQKNAKLDFKLFDSWLKFDTKWDRTTVWVGNKSIPYGHNPKIDPASNFMTNITKMDIGFVQDLGLFIKTPISKKLDAEISITTGGLLNKPFLVCDNLIDQNLPQSNKIDVVFSRYKYNNTFLAVTRLGNQTFNKNEFGVIALTGIINNTFIPNDKVFMTRLGADWVFKHNEVFKLSNQLLLGYSDSQTENRFLSINGQTSLDMYFWGKFFVSSSFAINNAIPIDGAQHHLNRTFANSLTYSVSTHTRIRLNIYDSFIKEMGEHQKGILLQFITGFGKRG
jgi:hypothetical protein